MSEKTKTLLDSVLDPTLFIRVLTYVCVLDDCTQTIHSIQTTKVKEEEKKEYRKHTNLMCLLEK